MEQEQTHFLSPLKSKMKGEEYWNLFFLKKVDLHDNKDVFFVNIDEKHERY